MSSDMETKHNYSNRIFFVLTTVCVTQFIAFIVISCFETYRRETLSIKLEQKREALANLTLRCSSPTKIETTERLTEILKQLGEVIKLNKDKSLYKRQASSGIQTEVQKQENILLKTCTNDTKICLQGFKGETGLPGDLGRPGLKGEIGTKGQNGSIGEVGAKGLPGSRGSDGFTGTKGVKGDAGSAGLLGDKGMTGVSGNIGDTGQNGRQGNKGNRGPDGPKGIKGQTGINGSVGQKGLKGVKGDDGSKGNVGVTGPTGATPLLQKTCDCHKNTEFLDKRSILTIPLGSPVILNCTTNDGKSVNWNHYGNNTCYTHSQKGSIVTISHLSPVDLGAHKCTVDEGLEVIEKIIYINTTDIGDGVSCDFEHLNCPWQLTNWNIVNNTADHTTLSTKGHFLHSTGNAAKATSLWISGGFPQCLTFWYKTQSTGTFPSPSTAIQVSVEGTACAAVPVDVNILSTHSPDQWEKKHVQLPENMDVMRIIMEPYRDNHDLSVDDIKLSPGQCPVDLSFNEPANTTITIPKGGSGVVNCSASTPSGVQFSMVKTGTCTKFPDPVRPVKPIYNARLSDAGIYTCVLELNGVKVEKTVNVIISGEESCNFEIDLCSYNQDTQTDKANYITQSQMTPSSGTGPNYDHTYSNASGHYLYIEASGGTLGDNAVLISPTLSSTTAYCLSLAYNMYGSNIGSLHIYSQECKDTSQTTIHQLSGDQGQSWNMLCTKIDNRSRDYQIYIEAIRGDGYSSDIAIDDVRISPMLNTENCTCLESYSDYCDFSGGRMCHWEQDTTDDFDWLLKTGATTSANTGPDRDHTDGTGMYIYIESSNPRQRGDVATILSNYLKAGQEYCLEFYYNMYGANIGSITVYRETMAASKTRYKLFTITGDHGTSWHKQQINIPPATTDFRFAISGMTGAGFAGDAALDDIRISSDKESTLHNVPKTEMDNVKDKTNTTFKVLCGIFLCQFLVFVGITVIEVQRRDTLQQKLHIKREAIRNISASCISHDLQQIRSEIYQKLNQLAESEGKHLSKRQATDNIQTEIQKEENILEKTCTNDTKICLQGIKGEQGPTGQSGANGLKGAPGIKGLPGNQGDAGPKGSSGSIGLDIFDGLKGPKGDTGTFGSGGDKGGQGDKGQLGQVGITGLVGPKGENGTSGGQGFQGPNGLQGEKGTRGIKGAAGTIGPKGEAGDIGQTGSQPLIDHACDCITNKNVDFLDPTNSSVTIPKGGLGLVNCSTTDAANIQSTITKAGRCNTFNHTEVYGVIGAKFSDAGVYTCKVLSNGAMKVKTVKVFVSGGSTCDFENGLCDWTQDNTNDTNDWTLNSGSTPSTGTGPENDHTLGNGAGKYLYLEASSQLPGDKANLISPLLSSSAYCLSFAYHMFGKSMGTLNVFVKDCDNPTLHNIWTNSDDKGQAWQDACIRTREWTQDHQLYIQAVRGSGYYSDIAIDDVDITAVKDGQNCSCFNIAYDDFCDFEMGLCHWQQSQVDDFDWSRGSGQTSTPLTGPDQDHTTGSGFYLYAEAINHHGQTAELKSEYLKAPNYYCLSFYYNMFGASMGTLNIFKDVLSSSGTTTRYKVYSLSGNRQASSTWKNTKLSIYSTLTFRIVLSADIGNGDESDIAIDDIRVKVNRCS